MLSIKATQAFHQVLVFLCIKSVPVPYVQPEERFLVGHVGPKESRLYRCVVRYGYHDVQRDDLEFERDLICSIAEFIRTERSEPRGVDGIAERSNETMTVVGTLARADGIKLCDDNSDGPPATVTGGSGLEMREIQSPVVARKKVRFVLPESSQMDAGALEELSELKEVREAGMAFIMGHTHVRAKSGSGLIKRLVIDVGYDFLKRYSRRPAASALSIPHAPTPEVGMICHV